MQRNFLQNIVFVFVINIIIKPIWIFGIDMTVQNTVGGVTYGHYLALFNLSLVFQILLDFGLHTYSTQKIAQVSKKANWVVPNVLFAKFLMTFVYFIAVLVIGYYSGLSGFSLRLLALLCCVQALNSFTLYFRSVVAALQHFKIDGLLSIVDRSIMIIVCGYLLFYKDRTAFKIEWFVYAQLFAFGISTILSLIGIFKFANFSHFQIHTKRLLPIMIKGLPYALLIFLMGIYLRADVYILERLTVFSDATQAGKYAATYRILDAFNNMSGVLFAGMLLPLFAKNLKQKSNLEHIVSMSLRLLLPVAVAAIIITIFMGDQILRWLYPIYDDRYNYYLLIILMFSYPFFCLNYIFATLTTAKGDYWFLIKLSLLGAALSILLNSFMVQKWGAMATASIALFLQVIIALCNYIYVQKKFQLKIPFSIFYKILAFAFFTTPIVYYFSTLDLKVSFIVFILIALYGIIYLLMGFIRKTDWKILT